MFSLAASNGASFADNFVDYVTNNWSQTLATLAVTYMVTLAFASLTSPGLCFKEGTLVETEDDLKPIEEIKEGDLVLAFDEQTGEQSFKSVARLFRNTTSEWYHITVNGEEIICTAEHPFYVVGLGFVPAKNLSVKDKLLSSDNSVIEIDSITIETLSTPETTYNFEVEDFHTYYVGETTVLAHNECRGPNPNGRKGGEAHQSRIQEIGEQLETLGLRVKQEYYVKITNGLKKRRFIDIVGLDGNGQPVIGYQVGVSTKAGQAVIRERLALDDIIDNVKYIVTFISYK